MDNLKIENCFIWQTCWGLKPWRPPLRYSSEGLLRRRKSEARIHRSFATRSRNIKNYQQVRKTNQKLKIMNLALFSVWEEARVWAHGNHSFDLQLSYLWPVSCSFPSWVPSGCTLGWLQWLDGHNIPLFVDMAGNLFHSQAAYRCFKSLRNWPNSIISGLPFLSPGDLPNPGIKPRSPALAGEFFTSRPPGKFNHT